MRHEAPGPPAAASAPLRRLGIRGADAPASGKRPAPEKYRPDDDCAPGALPVVKSAGAEPSTYVASEGAGTENRSGEEGPPVVKVRKPYTITKQRERWTEEEHGLFLEALNKYGRKWCKISDHIGTKTAVQIRSHAQKFFSRVEREKQSGNLLVEEVHIPPPRPKKKTPHPYPRKATTTSAVVDNAAPSTSTKEATPPPSGEQQLADTSLATVAAAASAAAAVAAVAVVVAAGQDVQAQLRASPPQGFPFFGFPPQELEKYAQDAVWRQSRTLLPEIALPSPAAPVSPRNPTTASEPPRKRAKIGARPSAEKHRVMSDGDSACSHEQQPSLSDRADSGEYLKPPGSSSLPGKSDKDSLKAGMSTQPVPPGNASKSPLVGTHGTALPWSYPSLQGLHKMSLEGRALFRAGTRGRQVPLMAATGVEGNPDTAPEAMAGRQPPYTRYDGWPITAARKGSPETADRRVREPTSPSVRETTLKAPSQLTTASGSDTMGSGRLGTDGSQRSKADPGGFALHADDSSGYVPLAIRGLSAHGAGQPGRDMSSGDGNGGSGGSGNGDSIGPAGGRTGDEERSFSEPGGVPHVAMEEDRPSPFAGRGHARVAPWLALTPALAASWQAAYHPSPHQDALMRSYMEAYSMQCVNAAMAARFGPPEGAGDEPVRLSPRPPASWTTVPPEHRHHKHRKD
mmetsp:Transcript_41446/g.106012  ORF Transcript_41446/g.106012 Transcript_41446/m.106012 type:complete len:685 (-) Transcript_41446:202-2256(-)